MVIAQSLPVEEIEATGKTQVRLRLSPEIIDEYAEDMKNGDIFPPLTVFAEEGSERYILADGFHRLAAAQKAGREAIDCLVYDGGMEKALLAALGANRSNGLRRTHADKQHAVKMALANPVLKDYQLRDIADICGVSHETVRKYKAEQNGSEKPAKKEKPAKGKAEDHQMPVREAPSQGATDAGELAQALRIIRSFPYSGDDAMERMELPDLMAGDVNYCADWLDSLAAKMGDKA